MEKIFSLKAENNLLFSKLDKQRKSCNNLRNMINVCKVYASTKHYKEHLTKAKNPEIYALEHADQLSAFDSTLTTLELNKVPTDLVSSDYIGELQKFLQTYESETAKIDKQIAENDQMLKEFFKVQHELNAYQISAMKSKNGRK